jgi:hypothetical protein
VKVTPSADYDYFTARGLRSTAPESLNAALRLVLDAMPTLLYGEPSEELTAEEQAVLKEGGVKLDTIPGRDPLAETAVQYAAIIESSLTTKAAAKRMGMPENQVRQMIARRTLYSILINNRRYIPLFQFEKDDSLVVNITKVNAALNTDLHPVEVYEWYTRANPDLFAGDDIDATLCPLSWLRGGGDVKKLVMLAQRL